MSRFVSPESMRQLAESPIKHRQFTYMRVGATSSFAGRLAVDAVVRDALQPTMTTKNTPSQWLPSFLSPADGNHETGGVGDWILSTASNVYYSLSTLMHGSSGSDKGYNIRSLGGRSEMVRNLKEMVAGKSFSPALSDFLSEVQSRLVIGWRSWEVPSALTGPLRTLISCPYSQSVFEGLHIIDRYEQDKLLLITFVIVLISLLYLIMNYYTDSNSRSYHGPPRGAQRHYHQSHYNFTEDGRPYFSFTNPLTWFMRQPHLAQLPSSSTDKSDTFPGSLVQSGYSAALGEANDEPFHFDAFDAVDATCKGGTRMRQQYRPREAAVTKKAGPSSQRANLTTAIQEDIVRVHHHSKTYRLCFPTGSLEGKAIKLGDIRHAVAKALGIPMSRCYPVVDQYPVPARDGSDNTADAYSFGWRNGTEGWCHKVGKPNNAELISSSRAGHDWSGSALICGSYGTTSGEEIVVKVYPGLSNREDGDGGVAVNAGGKKRRNKKGNKKSKSSSTQHSKVVDSAFAAASDTADDMGNAASKDKSVAHLRQTQRRQQQQQQQGTSARSGPAQLTSRSLEPPKYNINVTPHPEILALLTHYFTDEVKPQMEKYIASPPTNAKQRDSEYLILNERCERDVVLQLDELACDGNTDMRARRKQLMNAVHQQLKALDEAVIAAGGIKRTA
ncbi:hypothetical protein KEM54_005033 [Ascosphaera aggregata]|nr:hypothetical protein KEM54_005033 [Ascosphaera aggregata]